MERAIDIGRMCLELANFVDEVGPKIRRAIIDMLNEDRAEYSLQALTQLQRVILDTVKTLETSQGIQDEPEGYTGLMAEPLSEPQLRPKAITGIRGST